MKILSTTLILVFAASFATAVSAADRKKPNILMIMLDDLGKEWVSAYGADGIETPNIDALATGGVKFDNFYVMPQCTPTRLTFLTGQYPYRHGWVNHWDVPRWGGGAHYDTDRNPAIAKIMKQAGYKTAVAGKWQINDFRVQPEAMVTAGFDDYCMWTGYEGGNKPSGERYQNPYIHTKQGSKTYEGKFGADVFTDFLIDFMRENKDDPMFLYFPMCLPHGPLVPTPAEPDAKKPLEKHRAMVRYADLLTGRLIKALDELQIRENTIVIWTTDNGSGGGITGSIDGRKIRGGKGKTLESGICVPLIVNCPGLVPAGKASGALMTITDFLPTFAAIAGGEPSADFTYDGRDCSEALLGKSEKSPHDWIMAMGGKNQAKLTEKGVENAYVFRDRVLRTERFKLYVSTKGKPEKLIDLKQDPGEKKNIIDNDNPDAKKALEFLSAKIQSFPHRDNDPIYTPLPEQKWDVKVTAESQTWKK
ncbi:MAG: sulfatase-like hydrolase/transferase [Akkermansiaceae bacterium]